jgi:hypothetical protein
VVSFFAAIWLLALIGTASAQRIEITRLPAYGKQGSIEGRVTKADLSRVSVVVFSRVEGFSIQPGCKQTTVQPDAAGLFSTRITGDVKATHYIALLVPRAFVPLCHTGEPRIPDYIEAQTMASDFRIRPSPRDRVIHWSGFEFLVREWKGGPGNCVYDRHNVRVDREGRLHLAVTRRKGVYTCAEVVLTRSLGGYGTYRLRVASGLDTLSPALVFGFFTYSSFSSHVANREIDFAEVSRWGVPSDAQDAQFVIQPADTEGNLKRFSLNQAREPAFEGVWRPDGIAFRAFSASSPLEVDWQRSGAIRPLDQTVHLNLWIYRQPVANSEVVLEKLDLTGLPASR